MARKPIVPDSSEFELDGAALAAPAQIKSLHENVAKMLQLEDSAKQMEEDLKAIKSAAYQLRTIVVPGLMAEIGTERIESGGFDITVENKIEGGIPKENLERRAAAFAWLEEHDAGSIIKIEVSLKFGTKENDAAQELVDRLRSQGYEPEIDKDVHTSTLRAFARERLEEGEPIDLAALGLTVVRQAKAKIIKKK